MQMKSEKKTSFRFSLLPFVFKLWAKIENVRNSKLFITSLFLKRKHPTGTLLCEIQWRIHVFSLGSNCVDMT